MVWRISIRYDRLLVTYLKNGGDLEVAQQIATHESGHTTNLNDGCNEDLTLHQTERIRIRSEARGPTVLPRQ